MGAIFGITTVGTFTAGFMRYMTHGTFEILAYIIAGVAGTLISIALINHKLKSPEFKKVTFDSLNLIIIAIVVLFIAAIIEVAVTPYFFL